MAGNINQPFENTVLSISWNISLVALSVLVAMIGSFTALAHAQRMRESSGRTATWWMIVGGITLGAAIWSMHFIGMLAFQPSIPIAFDSFLTLASYLLAVAGASSAMLILRRGQQGLARWFAAASCLTLAVSTMHYAGMAAMRS